MFGAGYRTPAKGQVSTDQDSNMPNSPGENVSGTTDLDAMSSSDSHVRRSIGDWETGRTATNTNPRSSPVKDGPPMQKAKATLSQGGGAKARGTTMTVTAASLGLETVKTRGRVAEAKACLIKAKLQINSSRNLKAEIRADVLQAVERLYRLVKEAEEGKPLTPSSTGKDNCKANQQETGLRILHKERELESELTRKLEEHGKFLRENTEEIIRLKKHIQRFEESKPLTYASVAASSTASQPSQPVHSMVVSSAVTDDTSEDVIAKIRTAVNARSSGIRVDRLRKAREGKVVLGCQSRDELAKIAEKLKTEQPALLIEQKENKDPLVILKNVLSINTDDDILAALQKQNAHLLGGIPEGDFRAIVRYRRKARNPHECHVVLRVSPRVWQCLTLAGKAHIDLQRVQVCDQSPLLQCTKCLGFGHGKKSCTEAADLCSHCAGPHLRKDCSHWKAGEEPVCRNCVTAKLDKTHHNSFDNECPTRQKWDRLVRSSVAYC